MRSGFSEYLMLTRFNKIEFKNKTDPWSLQDERFIDRKQFQRIFLKSRVKSISWKNEGNEKEGKP